jgi:hypothetical protein
VNTKGNPGMQPWPGDTGPVATDTVDVAGRPDAATTARPGETPAMWAGILTLDRGLYAIAIGETGGTPGQLAGMALPAIHIAAPPSDSFDPVEILGLSGDAGAWLGAAGGTAVVRAPQGGGRVLITTYCPPGTPPAAVAVELRRLDRPPAPRSADPVSAGEVPAAAPRETRSREIRTEITLHVERLGDRRFPGQGWVGNRGHKLRIEAFSVQPLETLAAGDLEYKAFAPNGRETPWVSDGKLCGTRGRGLPLTGLAMRLAPHLRERFDLVYRGAFFAGGATGPARDGEPCISPVPDDPLEAINVRLVERVFE